MTQKLRTLVFNFSGSTNSRETTGILENVCSSASESEFTDPTCVEVSLTSAPVETLTTIATATINNLCIFAIPLICSLMQSLATNTVTGHELEQWSAIGRERILVVEDYIGNDLPRYQSHCLHYGKNKTLKEQDQPLDSTVIDQRIRSLQHKFKYI